MTISRRKFLHKNVQAGLAIGLLPMIDWKLFEKETPAIQLTKGPKQHWFGYYDKQQVDVTGRYVLGLELPEGVDFRSPIAEDCLRVGMVDLNDGNRWIDLDSSLAWSWQQSCLLQWIPGSKEEIIWNDRKDDQFVSHILNIKTGKKRTIAKAIYGLSPDGKFAITTDFARLQKMRPGYGYAGIPDVFEKIKAPQQSGIWKVDLQTGESKLIISVAEMAAIPNNGEDLSNYWHWFNHILVSPDGKRFNFLHRWRKKYPGPEAASNGFITRMYTANIDGSDKFCIDPSGDTSHFFWRDPSHILAWTKPIGRDWGFYLLEDKTGNTELVGIESMTGNGHNTYVPGTSNEWILNDTYPDAIDKKQTLYLYHVPTKRKIVLGRFYENPIHKGEWRCDLHPKASQDGRLVTFDSTHEKDMRQMFMVNIENIMKK